MNNDNIASINHITFNRKFADIFMPFSEYFARGQ